MSDAIPPSPNVGIPRFDDPMMVTEAPGWPKVIGIISIVWGALMLGCVGCGFAGPALQEWGMSQNPDFKNMGPIPDVLKTPPIQFVMLIVGGLMDIMLIIAGIMTLQRAPAARILHLVYGALAVVMAIVGIFMVVQMSAAQAAFMKDNPSSPWAKFMSPGATLGFGIGMTIFTMIWPLFTLVWFGLVKPRPEQMHGGSEVHPA